MPKDHKLTKAQKAQILKTFNSLERFEDRLWFYLHLSARNFIMQSDFFTVDERFSIDDIRGIRPSKSKSSKKNNPNDLKKSNTFTAKDESAFREALGLPSEIGLSKADEDFTKIIMNRLYDDLEGDGTSESKKETYSKIAALELKVMMDIADDVQETMKLFDENDPYREWKALYLTNKAVTASGMLDNGLSEFYTSFAMPDLETNREVLTEEEYYDFLEINEGLVDKLSLEDKKKYELGKATRSTPEIPKVKLEGSNEKVPDPVLVKWINETGNILVQNFTKQRMIDGYQKFQKDLYSNKSDFFEGRDLDSFYASEMNNINVMLLRGAKDQLQSTVDKKSKKNSELFENILNDVKKLDGLIAAKQGTKVHLLKEKIGKECLKYMEGKEQVRGSDYGKDRVDAILAIMAEVLPEYSFKKEIQRINTVRKARVGSEKYINVADYKHDRSTLIQDEYSAGKTYLSFVQKGLQKEIKKQEMTEENRTVIPEYYNEFLASIEGLYGRKFNTSNKKLKAAFDGIGGNSKIRTFKPINDSFGAVGKYGAEGRKLSEKDFVAVAYAGALTPEAASKIPGFADAKPQDKAFIDGQKYTAEIGAPSISSDIKKYADVIEAGRESAAEALKAYANGDKAPLAHILAVGIKNICDKTKNAENLNFLTIGDSEMVARMTDMMYRDPDLFVLSQKEGVGNEYLRQAKSLQISSRIIAKGMKSSTVLNHAEKNKTKLSKRDKVLAVTDVVMERVLHESFNMCNRKLLQNPEYKNEMKAVQDKYNKEIGPINAELSLNIVGKEHFERRAYLFDEQKRLDEYLELNKGILRQKYLPDNLLLNNLKSVEAYKNLKQSVAKVVESSGLYKYNIKDLMKTLDSKKFAENMSDIIVAHEEKVAGTTKTAPAKNVTQKEINPHEQKRGINI